MDKEKFTANPYNKNNKLIQYSDIINILNKHNINDFKINNIQTYQSAFIHKSYCKLKDYEVYKNIDNSLKLQEISYETLEFLGDSILGAIISDYLYQRYYELYRVSEGFLTKMKNKIVNGTMLGYLSDKLNLNEFMVISEYIENQCNGRNNERILEDIFEAFIGAIFLDTKDYNLIKQFIINIIELYIDFSDLIINDTNYKDQLLRYFQNNKTGQPKYEVIFENNKYKSTVYTNNPKKVFYETGYGSTKKKSEQESAKNTLIKIGILN